MNKSKNISAVKLIKMVLIKGKGHIFLHLLLRVLCGLLPVATALLWQYILRMVEGSKECNSSAIAFFVLFAIVGGLSVSYFYFTEVLDTIMRNKLSVEFQKEVHKKSAQLPMDNYEYDNLTDLIDRAGSVFCYGNAIGFIMAIFGIIQQSVSLISIIIAVWSFYPILTISAILLMVPGIIKMILNEKYTDMEIKLSSKRREANVLKRYVTERTYVKDIHMMDLGGFFLDKWQAVNEDICKEEQRVNREIIIIRIILELIEQSATICSYGMCLLACINKHIDLASFGALIVLVGQYVQNTSYLINQIDEVHAEALVIKNALDYFELKCDKRDNELGSIEEIELKNVTYSYPGSDYPAVNKVNLKIVNGELVVVVGKNGSGKTTLSKLILGLVEPSFGEVTANNIVIEEVKFPELYTHFSALFQDYVHYSTNVRDNIIISNSSQMTAEKDIYNLLESIGIDFIGAGSELTLDTSLGVDYEGIDLSGGQWQQLSIARAAFKDAKVIVLDEPTAAIDPLHEANLFNAFKIMCKNKIGVIISHRLGVCSLADRIIVMDEGRIVEIGTLNELLSKNGDFAKLYNSQKGMYNT